MGRFECKFSPFPPNYIAVTFRPADELWICQGPPIFIDFLRSLLSRIWPKHFHHERHCNVPERQRSKGNIRARSTLKNTVFRIPTNPFSLLPIHQSEYTAEAAYRFATLMVAFLYSMDYEMVTAGHFIRGTEASTCLFRCKTDHTQNEGLNELKEHCQACPSLPSFTLSAKHSEADELDFAKDILVIGLEGWNRLFCINITQKLISELICELRTVWPEDITFHKIINPDVKESKSKSKEPKVDPENEEPSSYLIEFEGHPWDSYKEFSDLTPFLILSLIRVLDQAGFNFMCTANIRGLLDTIFFIKRNSPSRATNDIVRICFSLCHQNVFRVYGGTPKVCSWISQLLQQLWIFGVASENEISFSQLGSSKEDSNTENSPHFTEIKFNGVPFCIPEWNKDNFFAAEYMIGRLLGVLSLVGWQLKASLNVYSGPYDKGLLVFEKDLVNDSRSIFAATQVDENGNACEEEKLVDLEVVEMEIKQDADETLEGVKSFDLLRPICLTSYDIDRLCILGGSQHFLLSLNNHFSKLFDCSQKKNHLFRCLRTKKNAKRENDSTELQDKSAAASVNWITSRSQYVPELVHKMIVGSGQPILCLLSPLYDNLALGAVAELDPNNILEYATNYKMWTTNSCWPPKMFRKTNSKAKKFFYCSQIPLAVLCWINEFINGLGVTKSSKSSADQDNGNDQDDIVELITVDQKVKQQVLKNPYTGALVTCLDCASTVRNGPPVWIYLIKERNQRVIMEAESTALNQL
ncbi:hypothetical protein Aperf_G00000078175 [Anoplocephala perfoliata]